MTTEVMMQLFLQFGLVPGLFVWLLYTNQKEHKHEREKSQEREQHLMGHIAKSDEALSRFATSLTEIGKIMNGMDKNMNYLQRDVEALKNSK